MGVLKSLFVLFVRCARCNGTGSDPVNGQRCAMCQGSGQYKR